MSKPNKIIKKRSRKPKRKTSRKPKRKTSRKPKKKTSRKPKRKTSRKPKRKTSRKPKRKTSRKPKRKTSRKPKRKTSRKPKRKTSRKPKRKTSRKPKRKTSRKPKRKTSRKPKNMKFYKFRVKSPKSTKSPKSSKYIPISKLTEEEKARRRAKWREKDKRRRAKWTEEQKKRREKQWRIYSSQYYSNDPQAINQKTIARQNQKYANDPEYRTLQRLRARVRAAIGPGKRSVPTRELFGKTQDGLNKHIASQFTEGMNWNNQGQWHIDHIIPCKAWNLENEEDQRICFSWMNLQPLWGKENLEKSGNYTEEDKQDLIRRWREYQAGNL